MSEWKSTACILCECNCGIEVQLGGDDGRRLVHVRGDDAHPASRGYACEKPSRLDFYQNGPHRLTKPLRRRADGTFEEIDWDTAIREVAARFAAIRDEHGGESIFYYGGGGQGNHLPGAYGARRARCSAPCTARARSRRRRPASSGSRRRWSAATRAATSSTARWRSSSARTRGSRTAFRARASRCARSRTTRTRCLIVIDPRRTETAEIADIHLQVKPGGDAFLLAAMIGVIVQEGLVKRDWLAEHADGLEEVLPHFTSLDVAVHARRAACPRSRCAAPRGASRRRRAWPPSRTSACR